MVKSVEQLSVNAIRTLSIDMIEKANSGHPGLPMGAAPMAYVLWTDFMKHNPKHSELAVPWNHRSWHSNW